MAFDFEEFLESGLERRAKKARASLALMPHSAIHVSDRSKLEDWLAFALDLKHPHSERAKVLKKTECVIDTLRREYPTVGDKLLSIVHRAASDAAKQQVELSPVYLSGMKSRVSGDEGRAEQKRMRDIGRKADEGKVKKAQTEVDRVNAAAQLWARGIRTRTVRDQLIFRGARVRDDGTVRITRNGMIDHIARVVVVPARTLYDWAKHGDLTGIPPARRKNT